MKPVKLFMEKRHQAQLLLHKTNNHKIAIIVGLLSFLI